MATNTMTASTIDVDDWLQFCQETLMEEDAGKLAATPTEEFFAAISGFVQMPEADMNPSKSCTSDPQLSPKSCILSKPIRRRSRVSKKTPIKLLNANTSNFRALVQKFTGCPSRSNGSFAHNKGPVTLNFQKGTGHLILQKNQSNVMSAWSTGHHGSAVTQSLAHLQVQQQQQQQKATFSSNILIDHGFSFGEDVNLQEIFRGGSNSFTGDDHYVKDGGYLL